MRIEESGALVLTGQTEARVLAHYFVTESEGRFLNLFEPPLSAQKMGWLAFANSRIEDCLGTSEKVEHRVDDPYKANIALQAIALQAVPNSLFFGSSRLGRRRFLQNMVNRHLQPEG